MLSPVFSAKNRQKTGRMVIAGVGTAFGVAFGVLGGLAIVTPQSATGEFQLGVELIRYTALGTGVIFIGFVLGRVLPLSLNLLERRGFIAFVAARHVRATKSGFLTVISVLSILGVSLSSCALCSVTSIMGGFGHDLKHKILVNNAHIVVDTSKSSGINEWEETLEAVRKGAGAKGAKATPVVAGDAMGSSQSGNTAGVLVRGIDPDTIGDVIALRQNIERKNGGVGSWEYFLHPEQLLDLPPGTVINRGSDGVVVYKQNEPHFDDPGIAPEVKDILKNPNPVHPAIIVGRELSKSLHVSVGDDVSLLSPLGELGPMGVMPRTRKFRVAGIFYSGMYEYDASHAYIDIKVAQDFFSLKDKITEIDISVPEPEKVAPLRTAVVEAVDGAQKRERPDTAPALAPLRIRDWMEMNKTLFGALQVERLASFFILCIAILVASFCIICTLLLMVTEKGRQIAILKALGASDEAIMLVFMLEGIIIGGIGTIFGVVIALAACSGLKWFGVRLDPDIYYIDRLPVNVDLGDYGLVALAALAICTIATIYPARAASKLPPVDGLRHE